MPAHEVKTAPAPSTDAVTEKAPAPPATPDRITALQTWVDQQNRLYRVAGPLLIKNADLCNRHARNLLGLTAKTKYSYSNDFADSAHAALGLGDRLRIMNVLPGSGAAQAGIRKGDVLLAIEADRIPAGPNAEREGARIANLAMRGRSSVNLTVLRDGKRSTANMSLTRACAFGIELGNADYVNSYADGHRVLITRGMLDFTASDEELAYVLAKEIAHNVLTQAPRPDMGAVIDRLSILKPGTSVPSGRAFEIKPYSPVLDATADKLSLYLLARAGYSIDNAVGFWKRLAARYPADVRYSHTALHPSTAYRFSVMTEITKAIKTKQDRKLPLVP